MKNIMIWIMLLLSITYTDAQNGKSPRKDYAKLANYDESKVPQYTCLLYTSPSPRDTR